MLDGFGPMFVLVPKVNIILNVSQKVVRVWGWVSFECEAKT